MAIDVNLLQLGAAQNTKPLPQFDYGAAIERKSNLRDLTQQQALRQQTIDTNKVTMDMQVKRQNALKGSLIPGPDGAPTLDYPTLFKGMAAYGDPELPTMYSAWQKEVSAQKKLEFSEQRAEDTHWNSVKADFGGRIMGAAPEALPLLVKEIESNPQLAAALPPNYQQMLSTSEGRYKLGMSLQTGPTQLAEQGRLRSDENSDSRLAWMQQKFAQMENSREVREQRTHKEKGAAFNRVTNADFERQNAKPISAVAKAPEIANISSRVGADGNYLPGKVTSVAVDDNRLRYLYQQVIEPGYAVMENDYKNQVLGRDLITKLSLLGGKLGVGNAETNVNLSADERKTLIEAAKRLVVDSSNRIETSRKGFVDVVLSGGYTPVGPLLDAHTLPANWDTAPADKPTYMPTGAEVKELMLNSERAGRKISAEDARKLIIKRKSGG